MKISRLSDKFEVSVSSAALCNVFVREFKLEFNPLPNLLKTGFTIVEIALFYSGEHLEAKICRFLSYFDKMAMCNDV